MSRTIDMTCMRYLNLFSKITGVRTQSCFAYNRGLVFAVPASFVSRAIGERGSNVRQISSILGKKIKIVSAPESIIDSEKFISEIVEPVTVKSVELTPNEIVVSASRQSKASLIGRDKARLEELDKIIKQVFGKSLRIN